MKTIRSLNIRDKPSYYFVNVTNINDFDSEVLSIDDFTIFKDGSIVFKIVYCEENNTPHVVFNNIECISRKSGIFSYLTFCESDKNKKMFGNYVKVIDRIKEEVLPLTIDKYEDGIFVMGRHSMKFKFKTNDNLSYNKKINVPVCVISTGSVFEKIDWYYPQIELQECFYESKN